MKQKHSTRVRLCEARSFPWGNAELSERVHQSRVQRLTTLPMASAWDWTRIEAARPVGECHGTRIGHAANRPVRQPLFSRSPNYAGERLGSKMH
jgi:hypothetical protein